LNIFKSTLVKTLAGISFAFAGLAATSAVAAPTTQVQAATPSVVTINYVPGYSINVWNNYTNPEYTGKRLAHGTSWKVFNTATDANGQVWYNLGGDQWIMAKYTVNGYAPKSATGSYGSTTTSTVSGAEAAAKAWIANRESGGNYNARNGKYIGKYQLSAAYLGGNYSPANQEKVADNYVKSRYGSWVNAKNFWLSHGWY
jgi:hypothetical protein